VYLLAFLFLFAQLVVFHGFRFSFHFGIINREWKMKLLKFGSYSMMLAGSFAVINNISYDQVTTILGPEVNGIFTTCFFIALIVEMPRRNMAKLIGPIISNEFEKKNMKEVEKLYKRASITMSIIGMLLFIGIVSNLQDLFDFIPKGDEFQVGFWVVVSVCSAKLVLMFSSFGGEIINYSSLYRYNLLFQFLAALLLIGLNYVLIRSLGLNGAAISYFTTIAAHVWMKLAFVKYHFQIHPFTKGHIRLILLGAGVGVGAFLLDPGYSPLLNIIIRSVLTTVVFVYFTYRFHLSSDINTLIHSTFERFLNIKLPK
jgi:O-antigen/teichoic acid export membrane protein